VKATAALFAIWFFSALAASAAWTQQQSETEPSTASGIVHVHIVMSDSTTGDDATLDFAKFSPKVARLRIIDNAGGEDLEAAMQRNASIAGVNGGYFDTDFKPLGLRIDSGKTFSNLIRARLMTGLIVGGDSFIRILRVSELGKASRPVAALQCGPFLVDNGQPIAGLNANRSDRRTFVAISRANEIALGVCSAVSLQQLSVVLTGLTDVKIQRALNFDGGSSTAFWFKRKNGNAFSISELKNVRDFVGIEPK